MKLEKLIKTVTWYLSFISLINFSSALNAQVTIGSEIEPNKGSLLDLKEKNPANPAMDNSTTDKGLGLPRVKLTTLTAISDISGATGKETEHTGLMVYNVNTATGTIVPGLYVWSGKQWLKFDSKKSADKDFFYMPSFSLPINTLGPNSYGIYNEYETQFTKAGLPVYQPNEIEFKVTYYDPSLISNILFPNDAGNRYMTYNVLNTTAPAGTYLNIIIVVK